MRHLRRLVANWRSGEYYNALYDSIGAGVVIGLHLLVFAFGGGR